MNHSPVLWGPETPIPCNHPRSELICLRLQLEHLRYRRNPLEPSLRRR